MPFAASLSTLADPLAAVEEACSRALADLPGPPDLAVLFFSAAFQEFGEELASRARQRLGGRCLVGCTGESIVGNGEEVEDRPALSVWLARWDRPLSLTPFHLQFESTSEGNALLGWPDELDEADPAGSIVLLLADPFTFPVDQFLAQVNAGHRGLRVVGGMASGAQGPGENCLVLDGAMHRSGAIGVLLHGPVKVRSIVSQGCRPIGQHMVITKAQDNIILELGGQSPLDRLRALWEQLSPEDQELVRHGLHLGRVTSEYRADFQRGDFLVRNLLGVDQKTGAIAVTDRVRVGQTVQFHVRDAKTADEDLHALLQLDLAAHPQAPKGALLFTCNGRGTRLFPEPNHDAAAVRAEAGTIPLAGFFAQGELGPVGGENFIHGFTASVVLFED